MKHMIITRGIRRNLLKKKQGNNRIQDNWRKFQDWRYDAFTDFIFTRIGQGRKVTKQLIKRFSKLKPKEL